MTQRIPVAGPWITDREVRAVADAAAHAWYEHSSTYIRRFEEAFARFVGRAHGVSVPHCTSAIHLALAALDVGPGDEVIVPDVTWIATSAPIAYVGATPVFADIDPETWCLRPDSFAACLTPRTKAVIPVDLYGSMPDMDAILRIAGEHGVAVIEDAAEAVGSRYRGRPAGAFGRASVFSFHGSKTLTTGEGGMLVTDDERIRDRALFLRDHGRDPGDVSFFNTEIAFKYRMSSLQAALGLAQLERIDELVAKKRRILAWYRQRLAPVAALTLNAEPPDTVNACWMTTVVVDAAVGLDKGDLAARLEERSIDCRPFFHPLSSLPAYRDTAEARAARPRNRTAYDIAPRGLNLPSALSLTEAQVDFVCAALLEVLAEAERVPG